MLSSIVHARNSGEAATAATALMPEFYTIHSGNAEAFAALYLAHSNIAEADEKSNRAMPTQGRIGCSRSPTMTLHVARAIWTLAKEADGMETLRALDLSPPYAINMLEESIQDSEDDEMMVDANDCALLVFTKKGVMACKRSSRAVELYSRAIDEGSSTHAMRCLATLLCWGEEVLRKT